MARIEREARQAAVDDLRAQKDEMLPPLVADAKDIEVNLEGEGSPQEFKDGSIVDEEWEKFPEAKRRDEFRRSSFHRLRKESSYQ